MKLQVENRPIKIKKTLPYVASNEYTKVEVHKKTLLFPIFNVSSNRQIGWYFEGKLDVIADLITHSKKGAIGRIHCESYDKGVIFPAKLSFLNEKVIDVLPGIKEKEKIELITLYINKNIVKKEIYTNELNMELFIYPLKQKNYWSIDKKATIFSDATELLIKTTEKGLFWSVENEIYYVTSDGNVLSTNKWMKGQIGKVLSLLVKKISFENFIVKAKH